MRADVNLDHREASGGCTPTEGVMLDIHRVAPTSRFRAARDGVALLQPGESVRHRPGGQSPLFTR